MSNSEHNSIELQEVSEQNSNDVLEANFPHFHWDLASDEQHASELLNSFIDTCLDPAQPLPSIVAAVVDVVGVQNKLQTLIHYIDTAEEALINYNKFKRLTTIFRNVFLRTENHCGTVFANLRSSAELNRETNRSTKQDLITRLYDFLTEVLSRFEELNTAWTNWENERYGQEEEVGEEEVLDPELENRIIVQRLENQQNRVENLNSPPRPPPSYHTPNSNSRNSSQQLSEESSTDSMAAANRNQLTDAIERLNAQLNANEQQRNQQANEGNRFHQENQQTLQQLIRSQTMVADQMQNLTQRLQVLQPQNANPANGENPQPVNNNFSLGTLESSFQSRPRSASDPARSIEQTLQVSNDNYIAKQSLVRILNKLSNALVQMNKLAENSVLTFILTLLEKNVLNIQNGVAKFIPELVQKLGSYIENEQIDTVTSSVFAVRVSQWVSDALLAAGQQQAPFRGGARGGGGANTQMSAPGAGAGTQKICGRFNELGYCDWVGNNGAACKFLHICSGCFGNHGLRNCSANSSNTGQRQGPGYRAINPQQRQSFGTAQIGMGNQAGYGSGFNHQQQNQFQNGSANFRL